MRFLCLVYGNEKDLETLARGELATLKRDSLDYDETLKRSGHFIAAHALQPTRTARTIRVRGEKILQTDGPFAETKEQLGGFILIDARDMDEATALASKIPMARVWMVEVRPVATITRD